MNLDKIDSRSGHKCRQNLADAVALASACWRGPGYANNSYTNISIFLWKNGAKKM